MFGSRSLSIPTPDQALSGRAEAIVVPERHTVLGSSLVGPWPDGLHQAVFGLGCFWGAERLFWQLEGVHSTAVGYSGGHTPNPTYEEVCSGRTGHTEAVLVVFDPDVLPYAELLRTFWEGHDPTQGMRQGNDVGTQYRSAIFVTDAEEREAAAAAIQRWNDQHPGEQVVMIIEGPAEWYPAEDYHQEYWEGAGQRNPYCLAVIPPKLMKLRKSFQNRVKEA